MSALRSEARTLTERRATPKVRFGFPRSDAFASTSPARPWDGWDDAATHRVRILPPAGLLIALGEHCVLALMPLPTVGCALGHIPVPGNLFKHMRTRAPGHLP